MTTFTSEAYKHANRTIDDVKVPTKCVIKKRLMMRKLRAKQRQQTNRDLTPLEPGKGGSIRPSAFDRSKIDKNIHRSFELKTAISKPVTANFFMACFNLIEKKEKERIRETVERCVNRRNFWK